MTTRNEDVVVPYLGYIFWLSIQLLLIITTVYIFDENILFDITMVWGFVGMIISPIIYTRNRKPSNKLRVFVITYLLGFIFLVLTFIILFGASMGGAFM